MTNQVSRILNEINEKAVSHYMSGNPYEISDLDTYEPFANEAAQDLLDHLKQQPELQPLPRIKSVHADNSVAIRVDEILAMLERELGATDDR